MYCSQWNSNHLTIRVFGENIVAVKRDKFSLIKMVWILVKTLLKYISANIICVTMHIFRLWAFPHRLSDPGTSVSCRFEVLWTQSVFQDLLFQKNQYAILKWVIDLIDFQPGGLWISPHLPSGGHPRKLQKGWEFSCSAGGWFSVKGRPAICSWYHRKLQFLHCP